MRKRTTHVRHISPIHFQPYTWLRRNHAVSRCVVGDGSASGWRPSSWSRSKAGMIPGERNYLEMLREVTTRFGILLIFDEDVSFRVAFGGAQEAFGTLPDLTLLGKLVSGGFPLAVFGGRAEIMALFDPSGGRPAISHADRYNGHPTSMVAGAVTLERLDRNASELLNRRGESLCRRARKTFAETGIPVQVTGVGALFGIHMTPHLVRSYRDTLEADAPLRHQVFLGLFNEGILIDPHEVGSLSAAVGDAEVDRYIEALEAMLARLPVVA